MIDFHTNLVSALETVLPTYYEMALTEDTETPCISYMEISNIEENQGDTVGYSRISYQIKIWANEIAIIQHYSLLLDSVLRPLGFRRVSSNEMHDINSTMIQKIFTYEALAYEVYNGG